MLFKHDMAGYQRMYAFLAQIFDYGSTAIEKRFIFYKRLLPLLEFGRERDGSIFRRSCSPITRSSIRRKDIASIRTARAKTGPLHGIRSGSIQERKRHVSTKSSCGSTIFSRAT